MVPSREGLNVHERRTRHRDEAGAPPACITDCPSGRRRAFGGRTGGRPRRWGAPLCTVWTTRGRMALAALGRGPVSLLSRAVRRDGPCALGAHAPVTRVTAVGRPHGAGIARPADPPQPRRFSLPQASPRHGHRQGPGRRSVAPASASPACSRPPVRTRSTASRGRPATPPSATSPARPSSSSSASSSPRRGARSPSTSSRASTSTATSRRATARPRTASASTACASSSTASRGRSRTGARPAATSPRRSDGEAFYDELTTLCVNQMRRLQQPRLVQRRPQRAVRRPRLGRQDHLGRRPRRGLGRRTARSSTSTRTSGPQGSACFIISVEDSVDDIWKLMGETARLFKFGSGVGADWSKLRSSHEKLSGGGQPSGPVSFMKVQDATGGTIKSGGKTRRAAIMQTLKAWHPDILEFVRAKQDEERKAWALIEEGYDGSFNGPAYGSVAFQNVNQSVRAGRRRDGGRPRRAAATRSAPSRPARPSRPSTRASCSWPSPRARTSAATRARSTRTRSSAGTRARTTGPINSSNPCSEYMFLDDSACNLASSTCASSRTRTARSTSVRYRAAARDLLHRAGDPRQQRGLPERRASRPTASATARSGSASPTSARS